MLLKKIPKGRRIHFEKLRDRLRGINQVETMNYQQRQAIQLEMSEMIDLAKTWGINDPFRGAGGRTCLSLNSTTLPCAFRAKTFIQTRINTHQNLAILTFKGESAWISMGYYPPPEVLVIELTHLPALKLMIMNHALVHDRLAKINLSAPDYLGMMHRDVEESLFDLWQVFCTMKNDAGDRMVREMRERLSTSEAQCDMIYQLYERIVTFGQQQEQALDFHCRLEISTELYIHWMQRWIDSKSRQPLIEDRESARIQLKLPFTSCGMFCGHP
jgi:hypothetical protein